MPAESTRETGYGLLLVPQPPAIRTIFFAEGGKQRLVFPHTLFAMFYMRNEQYQYSLKRLHVIFCTEKFTGDEEQKFYGLPIRNHDGAFATCFYNWPGEQTAEKFAHTIINQYWMSPYAEYNDWASWWTERYNALSPKFATEWVEATRQKNYTWIADQEMLQPDHHVNLRKLLEANKSHIAQGGVQILNLTSPKVDFNL